MSIDHDEAIILAVGIVCFIAMVCFFRWVDHQEQMAKINAGQKVEQPK